MSNPQLSTPNDLHKQPGLEHFLPRTMRYLIYNAKDNALLKSGAIIKLGRKVLIDVSCFWEWVNQHRVQQ